MARTYSLGKKQLIHGYQNFRRVIEQGKKHVGVCSILYAVQTECGTRVGIVAGKRIGNAVQRNKAKRLLREAVRLNRARIADGFEIVLIARKTAIRNTLRDNELDMMKLFERAGCLCAYPEGHIKS
jgi:ribonuclease P protein component